MQEVKANQILATRLSDSSQSRQRVKDSLTAPTTTAVVARATVIMALIAATIIAVLIPIATVGRPGGWEIRLAAVGKMLQVMTLTLIVRVIAAQNDLQDAHVGQVRVLSHLVQPPGELFVGLSKELNDAWGVA